MLDTYKIPKIRTPKVLFIKGVFKKDCMKIDEFFQQQILDEVENENFQEDIPFMEVYQKLPANFISLEQWPSTSNLLCWYCHLNFETRPVFIPKSIEPYNTQYSMGVHGVFCSFNCANNFINLYYTDNISMKIECKNKIKFLHKQMYNKEYKEVNTYPLPYEMDRYGGNLTTEQFKKKLQTLSN